MRIAVAIGILGIATFGIASCSRNGADPVAPGAPSGASEPKADSRQGSHAVWANDGTRLSRGPSAAPPIAERPDAALETPLAVDDSDDAGADALHEEKDNALRAQSATRIWAQWSDVIARGNRREMGLLTAALGERLHAADVPEVYRGIADRLYDPATGADEADLLVQVLELAATPESLGMLIDYLNAVNASLGDGGADSGWLAQVRDRVRAAIGAVATGSAGSGSNRALSPVLERAWAALGPTSASDDISTIGNGIAAIGAPSGVAALLDRAGDPVFADTELQRVARKSLAQFNGIDALPVLREALDRPSPDPDVRASVLDALVAIGAADSSLELVNRLRTASDLTDGELAQLSTALTGRSFPDESLKVFKDALNNGGIADERVRNLLRAVTAEPASGVGSGQP